MKSRRQEKIIELITENEVETQAQLTELLRDAGYDVTQATISRDIRELRLTKVSTKGGHQKYAMLSTAAPGSGARFSRVLREGYVSSAKAGGLLVVKTHSGMAMAVAAALDAMELEGFAGCIAGDDTIFCALSEGADADAVYKMIAGIVGV